MDRLKWAADEASLTADVPAGRTIRAGDLVVVYEGYQSLKAVYIDPAKCHNTRNGSFPHKASAGWRAVRTNVHGSACLTSRKQQSCDKVECRQG
jgi:hypothetical protein